MAAITTSTTTAAIVMTHHRFHHALLGPSPEIDPGGGFGGGNGDPASDMVPLLSIRQPDGLPADCSLCDDRATE